MRHEDEKKQAFFDKLERGDLFHKDENGNYESIIYIKSVFSKTLIKATYEAVKDGHGWYKGFEKLNEDDKKKKNFYLDPKKATIEIEDGKDFDLSNEVDKAYWDMFKWSNDLAISKADAMSGSSTFYIYIEGESERILINKEKAINKAKTLIFDDTRENLINRARLLNVDMSEDSIDIIQKFLIDIANKNAEKILDLYKGNLISIQLLFYKALDKFVIKKSETGLYTYGNTPLGNSTESCITFLSNKDNAEIVERIRESVDGKLGERVFSKKDTTVKENNNKIKEELASKSNEIKEKEEALNSKDNEIARLKEQLAQKDTGKEEDLFDEPVVEKKETKGKPGPKKK